MKEFFRTAVEHRLWAVLAATLNLVSCSPGEDRQQAGPDAAGVADRPAITRGLARMTDPHVFDCDVPGWRITAQGQITALDGSQWTVPAEVAFKSGPKATDLYNDCSGVMLDKASDLDPATIPVIEVDAAGEVITAYIFGDNYSEIYVNGRLVGVDPVPYWPFNTGAVRFRVKRPFTVGFKLVDWEENLGIGSETMKGVPFHLGDGGLTAVFKDAAGATIALTDGRWRALPYYVGPFRDAACLDLAGGKRGSSRCKSTTEANGADLFAAHWPVPDNWAAPDFDDSGWPAAVVYTNAEIGGSLNRPAYSNFADLFDDPAADAQFVWSGNLLLDNLVLLRGTVR